MTSDLKTSSVQLTDEQIIELEQLSAVGFTLPEMAMYFDINVETFRKAVESPDSNLNYHIERGKLVSKAKQQMSLNSSAEGGNVTVAAFIARQQAIKDFADSRKHFFYDDEKSYHKLEDYLARGSVDDLEEFEEIYLEVLTLMISLNRKIGKRKTIAFFTKKPYKFSRQRATTLFEKAIQYFYQDKNIEKQALRNMRAEMIMDAARVVMNTAKSAKDWEIAANMIAQASKLQRLDQPDPPEMPKGVYDKPIKIYVLDPSTVGISNINRDELAKQIDSLSVPEKIKLRAKQDALIENIEFEEIINELEKENKTDK